MSRAQQVRSKCRKRGSRFRRRGGEFGCVTECSRASKKMLGRRAMELLPRGRSGGGWHGITAAHTSSAPTLFSGTFLVSRNAARVNPRRRPSLTSLCEPADQMAFSQWIVIATTSGLSGIGFAESALRTAASLLSPHCSTAKLWTQWFCDWLDYKAPCLRLVSVFVEVL